MDDISYMATQAHAPKGSSEKRLINHATVIDIARVANVSPATVSRVINHPEKVDPKRVEAVRSAMTALDYFPPPLHSRRGPKSRQPEARSIGVWFIGAPQASITAWFHDQILQMNPVMNQRRISISAFSTDGPDRFPRQLERRGLDGLILQGMEPSESVWHRLRQIPTVWLMTRRSQDYPGDFVEPDNAANGRMAADHLAKRGHRKVAVLSTDPHYSAIEQRIQSFHKRCGELGLDVDVFSTDSGERPSYLAAAPLPEAVHHLVSAWASGHPTATGVYLPADNFVETFLRSAAGFGLIPNRQFEMILGNYSPTVYRRLSNYPPTIDINLSTLINQALDHLIWRIEHFDAPGRIGIQISPTLKLSPQVRVVPNHSFRRDQPQSDARILLSEA
jgi:DNA-binding LacI/PurR family transcriptional regulator